MKNKFIEEYLFHKYKSTPFKNKKEFRSRFIGYKDLDVDSLYLRINKYQVVRYGETLYEEKSEVKKNGRKKVL